MTAAAMADPSPPPPQTLWPFRKMHGLGNDFVVFDARQRRLDLTPAQIRGLSDRHTGIGCDQLVILEPAADADVFMRLYNADGSEVGACGNASRCVASLLGGTPRIRTLAGLLATRADGDAATVDMGEPVFDWDRIPLALAMDTLHMPVAWDGLTDPCAVNVGNPHLVFFVPDAAVHDLATLGPRIENDPLFPERVNVGVAQIAGPDTLLLRVWERGAGLTQACGTAACAAAVAAHRRGLAARTARVRLPGGELGIEWTTANRILMTGPSASVFDGVIDVARFG